MKRHKDVISSNNLRDYLGFQDGLTSTQFLSVSPFSEQLLKSRNRVQDVSEWRQLCMAYLYGQGYTQYEAGKVFGRDHATVIHAIKTVRNLIKCKDPAMMHKVDLIRNTNKHKKIQAEGLTESLINLENHAYKIKSKNNECKFFKASCFMHS